MGVRGPWLDEPPMAVGLARTARCPTAGLLESLLGHLSGGLRRYGATPWRLAPRGQRLGVDRRLVCALYGRNLLGWAGAHRSTLRIRERWLPFVSWWGVGLHRRLVCAIGDAQRLSTHVTVHQRWIPLRGDGAVDNSWEEVQQLAPSTHPTPQTLDTLLRPSRPRGFSAAPSRSSSPESDERTYAARPALRAPAARPRVGCARTHGGTLRSLLSPPP